MELIIFSIYIPNLLINNSNIQHCIIVGYKSGYLKIFTEVIYFNYNIY